MVMGEAASMVSTTKKRFTTTQKEKNIATKDDSKANIFEIKLKVIDINLIFYFYTFQLSYMCNYFSYLCLD